MTEEKKSKHDRSITIDLNEMYAFSEEDIAIGIQSSFYSNLAYIQLTHRDVFIDFLEMPGIKSGEKMTVTGRRVYMSFAAAQRLSEALSGVLEKAHADGEMEQYIPSGTKKPLSTKTGQRRSDRTV